MIEAREHILFVLLIAQIFVIGYKGYFMPAIVGEDVWRLILDYFVYHLAKLLL